jgi:FdhD protein
MTTTRSRTRPKAAPAADAARPSSQAHARQAHARQAPAPEAHAEVSVEVVRWRADATFTHTPDAVAAEAPLEVVLQADDGRAEVFCVTMRTPGDELALAMGLLLAEAVITSPDDLRDLHRCAHNPHRVRAHLKAASLPDLGGMRRNTPVNASCGLCGKTSAAAALCLSAPLTLPLDAPRAPAALLAALPDRLRASQPLFSRTGGLHAAALFDLDGGLIDLREDVGRHHALDKLLGQQALQGRWPLPPLILVLSGRVSFELIQKALAARLPFVVAVGAPSSLAISTAHAAGVTLIGFTRADRLNIYTHPQRVT